MSNHTPGSHNLDVSYTGVCSFCGGTKIVPAEHIPFDDELSDTNILVGHILALKDDAYFLGHPEWLEIVNDAEKVAAKATGEKEAAS